MVTRAVSRRTFTIVLAFIGFVSACRPELEGRPSQVDNERVLAVRSIPAEAKPNTSVRYEALFVSPDGVSSGDTLDWALCNERKALTQSGTISNSCLMRESAVLMDLGQGNSATAMLPRNACETFGPTPRTPKPGEPNFRPVDPDTTGGYYQPVRVATDSDRPLFADGMTRLTCGLGGATQEQSAEFNRSYRANENPSLDDLVLVRADGTELALVPDEGDAPGVSVARNEEITLRAHWRDCPLEASCGDGICSTRETDCPDDCTTPHGCTGSEPYLHFDALARTLEDRREAIRISWFATSGSFAFERTGQPEADSPETSSENRWTAPADSADTGQVWLWIVMRDDRGGVAWSSYRLQVN
jgi:hypothetical protein